MLNDDRGLMIWYRLGGVLITVATKQTHIPSPTTKSFIDGRTHSPRITLSPTFCLAFVDDGRNPKLVVSECVKIKAEWKERLCAVKSRLDAVVSGLLINFVYSWIYTCYCAMLRSLTPINGA